MHTWILALAALLGFLDLETILSSKLMLTTSDTSGQVQVMDGGTGNPPPPKP